MSLDIKQGGRVGKGTVTYPVAFSVKMAVVVTPYNNGNGEGSQIVHDPTATGFYWSGDLETYASGYIAVGI